MLLNGLFVAIWLIGCSESGQDGTDNTAAQSGGQIHLALTAAAPSGKVYRLSNALFSIYNVYTGAQTDVSTDADPDASSLDVPVSHGEYLVYLNDGFIMERIDVDTDEPVDAVLTSENPAYTEVLPESVANVSFKFLVNGEVVVPDSTISISITVEEAEDCTDDYEPNDSFSTASEVSFDPPISAVACPYDDDYFTFTPNVAEGEYFGVLVQFSNAVSDIDIALLNADGETIAYSTSVDNQESVGALSDGRPYTLYVYPYLSSSPQNPYTVSFVDVVESNCCVDSVVPGCTVPEVESCVCDIEPWCCEFGFDEYCVALAWGECDVQCELGTGSCCEASEEPGCGDMEVQNCVCALDMRCCTDIYDDFCVAEARAECGLTCDTGEPDSDCCTAGANPGCTNSDVESCVCGIDPFCCNAPFDDNCVGIATDLCGANC